MDHRTSVTQYNSLPSGLKHSNNNQPQADSGSGCKYVCNVHNSVPHILLHLLICPIFHFELKLIWQYEMWICLKLQRKITFQVKTIEL